jgi:hypothetical protein
MTQEWRDLHANEQRMKSWLWTAIETTRDHIENCSKEAVVLAIQNHPENAAAVSAHMMNLVATERILYEHLLVVHRGMATRLQGDLLEDLTKTLNNIVTKLVEEGSGNPESDVHIIVEEKSPPESRIWHMYCDLRVEAREDASLKPPIDFVHPTASGLKGATCSKCLLIYKLQKVEEIDHPPAAHRYET